MTAGHQTICLCMIVRNEAPVIRRCLDSVRPLIDRWLIVDTGSTDGTQDIIRAHLVDIPGALVERPWHDFARNRSESLDLARPHGSYLLTIDADDALEIPIGFAMPPLTADAYWVTIEFAGSRYTRPHLVKTSRCWRYEGVIHEYLTSDDHTTRGTLPLVMRINTDGARRRDPATQRRDIAVLERALTEETKPSLLARYTFYLAQTYRDCGEVEKALGHYQRRATMGFWDQEVYCSLLYAGRLQEQLNVPFEIILQTYKAAIRCCPARAEAYHAASRLCRLKGANARGYYLAKLAAFLDAPPEDLFVETWIYTHGLLDEYAVNAYWAGHDRDCLDACLRILERDALSSSDRTRGDTYMRYAFDRLARDLADHKRAGEQDTPRILVAILAKQKEPVLALYLRCIESLDYPKDKIVLYIRTNNSTDRTVEILGRWIERVRNEYAEIDFDASDVDVPVEGFGVHEWNATRFTVLAAIRNTSLRKTIDHECAFYFVADVDNFLDRTTLRDLVGLDLPIVAPMLRHVDPMSRYSNFHASIDQAGYFVETPIYDQLLSRSIVGPVTVPVVHCTYLIRADQLPRLRYDDVSGRHEYVVFSEVARMSGILQYLDNSRDYGLLTLDDDKPDLIRQQIDVIVRALVPSA